MSQIKKRVSVTVFAPNRLEALTDGVFAIVMTLLVLELSIPEIASSSLHAELPRVPFLSGWVDRGKAIPLVERAYAIAPAHPGNPLLLALTLLDLAPERRAEALELLRQVEGVTPRPSMQIEDLFVRRQARERLAGEAAALSKVPVQGEGAP